LLEYAYIKDKETLNEGLGSFIKNHIGKILCCIVLLVIFLPGAIIGGIMGFGAGS
jgi:hypothetical protein